MTKNNYFELIETAKIEKSQDFSFLNFQEPLSKRQALLFNLAIKKVESEYNPTKKRNRFVSRVTKNEVCKIMNVDNYNYSIKNVWADVFALRRAGLLKISSDYLKNPHTEQEILDIGIFSAVGYGNGIFTFYWNEFNTDNGDFPIENIVREKNDLISYSVKMLPHLDSESLLLYEYIIQLIAKGEKTVILTTNDLVELLKLSKKPKKGSTSRKNNYELRYIKSRNLKPAINEINMFSDKITLKYEDIKEGAKIVAVELIWVNKDKKLFPKSPQIDLAKQVSYEMELIENYFLDDKEFIKHQSNLKKWDKETTFSFGNIIHNAIQYKRNAEKELAKSGIDKINYEIYEKYSLMFSLWQGHTPTLSEKKEFIDLAEYFSEINSIESVKIINLAFEIAESSEASKFKYINQTLLNWKSKNISTKNEAEKDYDDNFGGYEKKQSQRMSNVKVDDQFSQAMRSFFTDSND